MFQRLGNIVSGGWLVFLLAWMLLLGLAYWAAPPLENVILDREFAFLPESSPSRQGEDLFKKAFPQQYHPSSLIIVLCRQDQGGLLPQDVDFIDKELRPGLQQIEEAEGGPAKQELNTAHPGSKEAARARPIIA